MKNRLIPIIITILLAGSAFAQIPTPEELFTDETMLLQIKESYNQQMGDAPNFLTNLFGNERINIYMNGYIVHLITQEGRITNVGVGDFQDQTMNVYASKETVRNIINEELTIKEALDSKLISYQGVGFGKKVKFTAVKAIFKIVSWFT